MNHEYIPKLYNGDFLKEYKNHLRAKETDLFLSDIPYGIFANEKMLTIANIDPVINLEKLEAVLDYILTKTGIAIIFCDFELLIRLKQSLRIFEYRYHFVLEKSVAMPRGTTMPINNVEYLVALKRKETKATDLYFNPYHGEQGKPYQKNNYNLENPLRKQTKRPMDINETGKRWVKTVIPVPNKCNLPKAERSSHKFQKPESLLRKMILIHSEPGSLVVDGFAGSASTLLSAYKEKRRSIGFEIDKKYYDEASKRIQITTNQMELQLT
ncbi:site-specific DNA-methyltransferase [Methanococcoides sp. SA1]|nr:site-specific DNA-methyltransferase [Methanococcoides sp. SA1]